MFTSIQSALSALEVQVVIEPSLAGEGCYDRFNNQIFLKNAKDVSTLGHETIHVLQTIMCGGQVYNVPCKQYLSLARAEVRKLGYCIADQALEAEAFAWEAWYTVDQEQAMAWLVYQLNKAVYATQAAA